MQSSGAGTSAHADGIKVVGLADDVISFLYPDAACDEMQNVHEKACG